MDDPTRRVGRLEANVKELGSDMKGMRADMSRIGTDIAEIKGTLKALEGRFEARMNGLDGRFAQIPTVTHFILFVLGVLTISGATQWVSRMDYRSPMPAVTAPR